jgi:hypothetical protein
VFTSQLEQIQGAAGFAANLGAVVVASAGNAGVDLTGETRVPCVAGAVICVGGVGRDRANVFNFGDPVDLWAPTTRAPDTILSTVTTLSAGQDADDTGADELMRFGGTSASAPFVSGVVALMKTLDPELQWAAALHILQATANPSPDPRVRTGYVDALRAVQAVSPNGAPTVAIGAPAAGERVSWRRAPTLGATVVDPETPALFQGQVQWTSDVDGPLCAGLSCASAPLTLGSHVVTALATDPWGAAGSASVTIEVVNAAPAVAVTYPPPGSTFFAGQLVTLRAVASDPDGEPIPGAALTWSSDRDGALGAGADVAVTLSVGAHAVTVTAVDGLGAAASATVPVEVRAETGRPSVRIVSPASGTLVAPGQTVRLVGEGTDPEDGALPDASLAWRSDRDGLLGTGAIVDVVLSGPAVQCEPETVTHTVTLTATDSAGNTASVETFVGVGIIC